MVLSDGKPASEDDAPEVMRMIHIVNKHLGEFPTQEATGPSSLKVGETAHSQIWLPTSQSRLLGHP